MRRVFVLASFATMLFTGEVGAQTAHGDAYVVSGPGRFGEDSVVYTAAGGEYLSRVGIGAALELGSLTGIRAGRRDGPPRSTLLAGVHLILPLADHNPSRRVQPFAIVGLAFKGEPVNDSAQAYIFGGGANIWIGTHIGGRLDFRVPGALLSGGGGIAAIGMVVR